MPFPFLPLLAALSLVAASPLLAAPPAESASIQDEPYPGTLKLLVDATDVDHRIYRVRESIPAPAGPLTLLFPQWIPGHHSASGPIDQLAGLVVTAGGRRIEWKRDPYDVYAFHMTVPTGAPGVDVEFQTLTPLDMGRGRIVMTPDIVNVQWNQVSLYPARYRASQVTVEAKVTLPPGFRLGTALDEAARNGDTVTFKPIDYDTLVDSPVYAGRHFRRLDLDPKGRSPVHLDIVADSENELNVSDKALATHRKLIEQMDRLYGARHFDHYDFLLALSTKLGGIGLEHQRSSEDSASPRHFIDWDNSWLGADILAHEYNHSWNGKYRRGEDLATPNFNVPMGDSLLWVYEGQTHFWGNVVAARAGFLTQEQARDMLALVAATYDRDRTGLSWRTIGDTTNDPTLFHAGPPPYPSYQLNQDYYQAGQLMWLDVDTKLRELTGDKRSLDDFAKAFFGIGDGDRKVNPYTFEDVVAALNALAPFDWARYLHDRVDGHKGDLDGIKRSGWKLVYTAQPSEAILAYDGRRKYTDLTYSAGVVVSATGEILDVRWDSAGFNAGLAPGMHVVAVNDHAYDGEALKDAVSRARTDPAPVRLLVKNFDQYRTVSVDYHGGLLYPHLERDVGKPDWLAELYKAR